MTGRGGAATDKPLPLGTVGQALPAGCAATPVDKYARAAAPGGSRAPYAIGSVGMFWALPRIATL